MGTKHTSRFKIGDVLESGNPILTGPRHIVIGITRRTYEVMWMPRGITEIVSRRWINYNCKKIGQCNPAVYKLLYLGIGTPFASNTSNTGD